MPKLWDATIEEHRRAVRDAALDAAAALITKHGLRRVTMSQVAEETGVGRATLYKYFPDVEALLAAWHERQIAAHLAYLNELAAARHDPIERLSAVLEAYAFIQYEHRNMGLDAVLHRGRHVDRAKARLRRFIVELLVDAVASGEVRRDIPPGELARYCLNALAGARELSSKAAVRRLVSLTLSAVGASQGRHSSRTDPALFGGGTDARSGLALRRC